MKPVIALALLLAATGCAGTARPSEEGRAVPVVTNPNVIQREESDDYVIRGLTIAELRRQIATRGPTSAGTRFAGTHSSRFRYSWTGQMRAGKCSPRVTVELYSITTLPRWEDSAKAVPDVQAAWGSYISALRLHEDNHRLIAFRYASDFQRKMVELYTPTCEMLGPEVRKLSQSRSNQAAKAQVEYDTRTRHGLTEGATMAPRPAGVLPPPRRDTVMERRE